MSNLEQRIKSVRFWLRVGILNHMVALLVVLMGCALSDFRCEGEAMSSTLSIYTFTLFTPQVALEVILVLAIFLLCNSLREFSDNARLWLYFFLSLIAPIWLVY